MANNRIDKINVGGADYDLGSTNFVFDTYAEYQAAYSAGDIPVGSVVYIKEGSTDNTITALQVVYNNGTVKSALDELNNDLAEVNNKIGHKVLANVTVTSGTISQALNTLASQIDITSLNIEDRCNLVLSYANNYYHANKYGSGHVYFGNTDMSSSVTVISTFSVGETASTYLINSISSNGTLTHTDHSNDTISSSVTFKLML